MTPLKANRTVLRVRAVIQSENYFLLARIGSPPIYFLPGGRLEPGEQITDGIKRELEEESKAKVLELKPAGMHEQYWTEKGEYIHEINFLFFAELNLKFDENTIATNDPDVELIWIEQQKISQIDFRPQELTNLFKSNKSAPYFIKLNNESFK